MSRFRINVPISRVEKMADGKLLIEGTATTEAPVWQMTEIGSLPVVLSYEASLDAMSRWAGNIREQHQSKAVGRAVEIIPNDSTRAISVRAFISKGAPDTQEKILDGTLRGYSIGGDPKAWKDADGKRNVTAWDCVELSVVDVGADPGTNDLVVLTRGAHLEPGLTGHKEAQMGKTAAAAVETEAPAPTVTTIGNSEVTIDSAGNATVKPLARAVEIPPPVVVAASTGSPAPNRFALAMAAAVAIKKEETMTEAEKPVADEETPAEDATETEEEPEDGIKNESDLMSAVKKSASADDPAAEKTKIKKAAKRLGLVAKLPRTWRAVKPELLRHMAGGDPADDLTCAIGCLRSVGWISRDVEYLLASEMAEGLGGGPTEGGQVVILQGVLASLQAACAGLKEFIADEASEGAAGGAEAAPEPAATVESAEDTMVESAAKPRMVRGLVALNRRLASLETLAKTPATVPAFTSADAEQLATAMGQVFGSTTAPLSRALGDLGNEVKAVREELDQVLRLPKPYGAARGVQTQRRDTAPTGDVQPAAKLAVLRDLASRTNNPVSLGEIQVEINRAEALLKGNPG